MQIQRCLSWYSSQEKCALCCMGSRLCMLGSTSGMAAVTSQPDVACCAHAQAFVAGYSAPAENLGLLDGLIRTRGEMAAAQGARSYAHLALHNATLAEAPEAVQSFLLGLAAAIRPRVGPGLSNGVWPRLCIEARQAVSLLTRPG